MASAKRKQKQEEKNLTVLRVLASQPGNKECFDCHQRGPTYVNMTIGSFVCTSCSGMLRGLTPPHRVKSISMATFTQEEIDFIMERGNDYCRRVWLGLMNANQMPTMDTKDEQKMRDLMRAKYELKTYYLDPSKAGINQNSSQKSQIGLSSSSASSSPSLSLSMSNQFVNSNLPIPKVPYSTFGSPAMTTMTTTTTTTTILPAPTNQKSKNNPENAINANNFTADFVADFSKVPDPFVSPNLGGACPKTVTSHHQSTIPEQFFANFDNNPAFNDSPKGTTSMLPYNNTIGGNTLSNMNMNGTAAAAAATPAPPSEDRYAALKDLDSLMKQTQLKDDTGTTSAPATTWNANNSIALNSVWGTNATTNQNAHVISNPFTSGDLWRPSANIVNNNNNTQAIMSNVYHHPPNPFKQMQFPLNNDSQWMGLGTSNNGDDFSKLMTPLPNKVWQPTVSAYHANPFMVGSGLSSNMTRNSNNPFL